MDFTAGLSRPAAVSPSWNCKDRDAFDDAVRQKLGFRWLSCSLLLFWPLHCWQ
jgi:hypothetical protein